MRADQPQRLEGRQEPILWARDGFKYEPRWFREQDRPAGGFVVGVAIGLAMWATIVILCLVIT